MKKKVKITALPKAQQGLNVGAAPWGKSYDFSEPGISVNSTLQPVPRAEANLEAEKGEIAMLPGKGGIPSTFKIGGNRHSSGGTPLNLPPDSFIFSDTKKMKIKDPEILMQFGKKGGSYTPAKLAKQYNINDYKKVLADPDADDLQKETAEGMISNYNLKLSKLALLQESKKGFPQGIPIAAMPYIETMQMDPSQFLPQQPQMGQQPGPDNVQMSMYGGQRDYFQTGGGHYSNPGTTENDSTKSRLSTGPNKYTTPTFFEDQYDESGTYVPYPARTNPARNVSAPVNKTPSYFGDRYDEQGNVIESGRAPKAKVKVISAPKASREPIVSPGFGRWDQGEVGTEEIAKEESFKRKYPDHYKAYIKALNSDNPADIADIRDQLESYDVPGVSFGIFPGTDQDKFQDLAGILDEKLNPPALISDSDPATRDKKKGEQAKAIYDNIYSYYKAAPEGSKERLILKGTLDEAAQYHPSYRENNPHQDEILGDYKEPGMPRLMYGSKDSEWLADKLFKFSKPYKGYNESQATTIAKEKAYDKAQKFGTGPKAVKETAATKAATTTSPAQKAAAVVEEITPATDSTTTYNWL